MAHRIITRFAFVIFAISMVSGHNVILDIVATIFLTAAIVSFLLLRFRSPRFTPTKERPRLLFKRSRLDEVDYR